MTRIAIAAVVLAVVAVGVCLGAWWKVDQDARAAALAQEEWNRTHATHVTRIKAEAPGFDDAATAIPVQVTGTDRDGQPVDEVQFMRPGAMQVSTLEGSYDLKFPGGYFTGSGSVAKAPDTVIHLEVWVEEGSSGTSGGASSASIASVQSSGAGSGASANAKTPTKEEDLPTIVYVEVPALEVTDDLISEIEKWASLDEQGGGKAADLRAKVVELRDKAVADEQARIAAEEEARRQAEEEAARAARHYEDSYVSLDMPASWVGNVDAAPMGHTSGAYHTDFTYRGGSNPSYFMIFRVDGMAGSGQGACSWADLGSVVWDSTHGGQTYKFSNSELEQIVNMMTGGATTVDELLAAGSKEACRTKAKPIVDAYMNDTVVPTVVYK